MAGIPQAAGVANGGDLTLNRVTVMHNANTATSGNAATVRGAGVSTLGSGSVLRLVESTVSGNTASAGATSSMFATGAGVAQSQGGALEITRSTIEGNSVSASANNAGSSATAAGAGVRTDLSSGLTTITGSTISGNTATARGASTSTAQGGGIRDENTSAAVDIRGSTLASNTVAIGSGGGGPSLDGANASFAAGIPAATEFSDSILADPVGAGSCSATHPFSGGYNLDSENTCGFDTLVSGDVFNADPMLGPLADNGGPTQTRGLLPGSAAIDQGLVGAGETTDQRGTGYVRVFDQPAVSPLTGGDESDIGAFELQVPAAPTFTGTDPGSGSNLNTPKVRGSAPTDSTVQLYTNAACTSGIGSPAPAATFAAPGIPVSVADNSTTTFFAKASLPGAGGTSACSPTSITYAEVTPVPLPGGGSGAAGGGGGQAAPSPVVPTKCKKGQKLKRGKCVKQKRKKKK
jgi:hypothetical protein